MNNLLDIRDLCLSYGSHEVLHHINMTVQSNQFVVIVGESGSGKSTLLKAIIGLLDNKANITKGNICFEGKDIDYKHIRGIEIGMIFQEALSHLDDHMTIEDTFYELLNYHFHYDKIQSRKITLDLLNKLKLDESVLSKYPFELSGGMAQRISIALALSLNPKLLLADEATSSLDLISQKQVLDTLLAFKNHLSLILVTHNIQVASYLGDYIIVMKDGNIVEQGNKDDVLKHSKHEYTKQLVKLSKR